MQAALAANGVQPGDRVAVFAGNRLEMFAAWLGVVAHGALVTTVNLLLGPTESAAIVDSLDPALVLALPDHHERATAAAGGRPVVDLEAAASGGGAFAPVPREPDDHAVIAYTSGTTGPLPKGAVHCHRVLAGMLESTAGGLGLEPGDAVLSFLPQFQLPAMTCSPLTALALGGSCLLFDRADAPGVAKAIGERDIRYFASVPTAMYDLVVHAEANNLRFEGLRVVTIGGAPVSPELRQRAARCRHPRGHRLRLDRGRGRRRHRAPRRGAITGILRPSGAGRGPQHPRRLLRRMPRRGRRRGVRRRRTGHRRILAQPRRNGGGDPRRLVPHRRRRPDRRGGRLYVVDRIKDLIIRGGFNISPAEVERALTARDDVAEAAVLGRPDERLGEVPVAYVVAAAGATPEPDELIAYARAQLGPVKTPVAVEVVEAAWFPRSALGKVQKAALAERLGWRGAATIRFTVLKQISPGTFR